MVGSWVGAGPKKDQAWLEAPHPLRRDEGLEIELLTDRMYEASTASRVVVF